MATRIQEKKVISNEEYNVAYANPDYLKIMRNASNRFRTLSSDVRKSCAMNALWLTLQYHKDGYGQKFTTNLHRFVVWECCKEIARRKKTDKDISLDIDLLDGSCDHNMGFEINDCIDKLPKKLGKVIKQKYFQNMTLAEIGDENGYSKQWARINLHRGLEKLRLILKKCV